MKRSYRNGFFVLMGLLVAIRLGYSFFGRKPLPPDGPVRTVRNAEPRVKGKKDPNISIDEGGSRKKGLEKTDVVERKRPENERDREDGLYTITHFEKKLTGELALTDDQIAKIEEKREEFVVRDATIKDSVEYKEAHAEFLSTREALINVEPDIEAIKRRQKAFGDARRRLNKATQEFDSEYSFLKFVEGVLSKEQLETAWGEKKRQRVIRRYEKRYLGIEHPDDEEERRKRKKKREERGMKKRKED